MHHFFAYMSRMKHIKRWGLMRNTREENVQEHTAEVAIIAHALGIINNTVFNGNLCPEHLAALALFHEAGEVITGDLATPIKYFNPDIAVAFKEIEGIAENKMLDMLPDELREAYLPLVKQTDIDYRRLLKAADRIAAYIKCLEEKRMGNGEFDKALISVKRSICDMAIPEADYFMNTFIDSYSLTLDELN